MITVARLTGLLEEAWGTLAPGAPPSRRLDYLMLTKGNERGGKTVFLVFAAGDRRPRFAVKLGRSRRQNVDLEADRSNLVALKQYGASPRVRIPEILLSRELDGHVLLVESVIEGLSLWEAAAGARSSGYVAPIADWLGHLGRATPQAPSGRARRTRHLSGVRESLGRHAGTRAERELLDRVAGLVEPLARDAIPVVFEQRDMGTWNVMVARTGEIGIVDWESASPDGFPAWDVFYFLAHYGFMVHGAVERKDRVESFVTTFFSDAGFGSLAARTIRQYAESLALERAWLIPLFLGCWLHHTHSEVSRLGVAPSESLFWQLLIVTVERLDGANGLATGWG